MQHNDDGKIHKSAYSSPVLHVYGDLRQITLHVAHDPHAAADSGGVSGQTDKTA